PLLARVQRAGEQHGAAGADPRADRRPELPRGRRLAGGGGPVGGAVPPGARPGQEHAAVVALAAVRGRATPVLRRGGAADRARPGPGAGGGGAGVGPPTGRERGGGAARRVHGAAAVAQGGGRRDDGPS